MELLLDDHMDEKKKFKIQLTINTNRKNGIEMNNNLKHKPVAGGHVECDWLFVTNLFSSVQTRSQLGFEHPVLAYDHMLTRIVTDIYCEKNLSKKRLNCWKKHIVVTLRARGFVSKLKRWSL